MHHAKSLQSSIDMCQVPPILRFAAFLSLLGVHSSSVRDWICDHSLADLSVALCVATLLSRPQIFSPKNTITIFHAEPHFWSVVYLCVINLFSYRLFQIALYTFKSKGTNMGLTWVQSWYFANGCMVIIRSVLARPCIRLCTLGN